MEVRFFATLRAITGTRSADVAVPESSTARQLLDSIVERFPALEPELIDESGALRRRVHLMIDGRSVVHLPDGLATRLRGDETVDVFPAVAGG